MWKKMIFAKVKSAWLYLFGCKDVDKRQAQSLLSVDKDKKETTAGCSQPSPDKTTDSVISVEGLMREMTSFRIEIKQTNLDLIPSIES